MITKTVQLHIGEAVPKTIIECTEGDTMWEVHFRLYIGSVRWTIPTGASATFCGLKKDGNVFDVSASISSNEVVVSLTDQMTAIAGDVYSVVRVFSLGSAVASCPCILRCAPNPQSTGTLSDTVLSAYNEAVQALAEAKGVTGIVSAWLAANMTNPSNPAIDTSLSVSGAGADAKVTGTFRNAVMSALMENAAQSGIETGNKAPNTGTNGTGTKTVIHNGSTTTLYGCRSKEYLDKSILAIQTNSTYYAFILAWNSSDTYAGWWDGSSFVTTTYTTSVQYYDFAAIVAAYPTYNFKLVIFNTGIATQPSVADVSSNLFYLYRSAYENQLSYATVEYDPILLPWEMGNVGSTGNDSNSTSPQYIRTKKIAIPTGATKLYYNNTDGTRLYLRIILMNGSTVLSSNTKLTGEGSLDVGTADYFRCTVIARNGDDVSTADGRFMSISVLSNSKTIVKRHIDKEYRDTLISYVNLSMFQSIGVIGDSFSSGSLHHPAYDDSGWTGNYDLSWCQILGRRIGATVTNYTKGGLSSKTWLANTDYGLAKLLADDPLQLYVIMLGINDNTQIVGGTLTLGTIDDVNVSDYTQNPDTFFGDYGRIIGNIMAHAPYAKIVCLSVARLNERNMDQYIKQIADKYGIPFIDLTSDEFFVSDFYYDSIVADHPLAYGYAGMACAIERLIRYEIATNRTYWSTYYGLVDTDTSGDPDE